MVFRKKSKVSENENLGRKMAFSESLVLFSAYLCKLPHKKIKIFVGGKQKLFTFKEFSLLNYTESSYKNPKFLLQNLLKL